MIVLVGSIDILTRIREIDTLVWMRQVRTILSLFFGLFLLAPQPVLAAFPQRSSSVIVDNFNGTALDTKKWTSWTFPSGSSAVTLKQEGGVIRIKILLGQTEYSEGGFKPLQTTSGDFEVQADVSIEQVDNKNTHDVYISFGDSSSSNRLLVSLRKRLDKTYVFGNTYANNVWSDELSAQLPDNNSGRKVTIRMIRTGSTVSFYYKSDSSFILLGSRNNIYAGEGQLIFAANTFNEFPGFTSTIDNVRISKPGRGGGGNGAGGGWEAGRESTVDSIRERFQSYPSGSAENQKDRCSRLQNQGKKILTKYQQRIERLNKYLERVLSRRTKLQTLGKDVSKIDKTVSDIKAHIVQVQTVINQEQPTLLTVNCTGDLKAQAQAMRTSMQKIRQSFTEGNIFLRDLTKELRETTIHK